GRVAALLSSRFDVVAARHTASPPPGVAAVDLDLLDPASLASALERARPHAVVHCAAQSNPDRCEREPEPAARPNVGATAAPARAGTPRLRPFPSRRARATESIRAGPARRHGVGLERRRHRPRDRRRDAPGGPAPGRYVARLGPRAARARLGAAEPRRSRPRRA